MHLVGPEMALLHIPSLRRHGQAPETLGQTAPPGPGVELARPVDNTGKPDVYSRWRMWDRGAPPQKFVFVCCSIVYTTITHYARDAS
jgi:hypothetical protein